MCVHSWACRASELVWSWCYKWLYIPIYAFCLSSFPCALSTRHWIPPIEGLHDTVCTRMCMIFPRNLVSFLYVVCMLLCFPILLPIHAKKDSDMTVTSMMTRKIGLKWRHMKPSIARKGSVTLLWFWSIDLTEWFGIFHPLINPESSPAWYQWSLDKAKLM